jgi:aryl-alcohol dehydrogenase-like predicted oxidoreductase
MKRTLGRSGIEVSAVGMGCWAIGGPINWGGKPVGWGQVNDAESVKAIHRALDLGVNFFDTATAYGGGHSERILGKALAGKWDEVIIATKFGIVFEEGTGELDGQAEDVTPEFVRTECEASLRRLGCDAIDLLQFHINDYPVERAGVVRDACEALVREGKIKTFGWSTDFPDRAAFFAESPQCTAIQLAFNVFQGNDETMAVCEREHLAAIIRSPLAMGILTGKFTRETQMPEDDVRRHHFNLAEGPEAEQIEKTEAIRDILTSEGRTPAQGAIAWLWARSPMAVPIPGFKSVEQVEQNAGAMDKGPLTEAQMNEIAGILGTEQTA